MAKKCNCLSFLNHSQEGFLVTKQRLAYISLAVADVEKYNDALKTIHSSSETARSTPQLGG